MDHHQKLLLYDFVYAVKIVQKRHISDRNLVSTWSPPTKWSPSKVMEPPEKNMEIDEALGAATYFGAGES
jgi:hypothetical protein